MDQSITAHLIYNLANTTIRPWPFPHLYFENAFPDEFYLRLQDAMPPFQDFDQIAKIRDVRSSDGSVPYKDRFVISFNDDVPHLQPPWKTVQNMFMDQKIGMALLGKFEPYLTERLAEGEEVIPDALLIRDRGNYSLGPHTDHPLRLVILIIYLPLTDAEPHLGTSLYVPKEDGFTCAGGEHYEHEKFHRAFTAPYKPNSALAFVKTNNSFHGVEPVTEGEERTLFHFFIKKVND